MNKVMPQPADHSQTNTLDLPAIATFCAFGFFLDDDTYFTDSKYQYPDSFSPWLEEFAKFKWYYNPRDITLGQATDEFAELFTSIIESQVRDKKVILPLSGGLDSRTQAAALKILGKKVHAFSYRFKGGLDETSYARRIAEECGFAFENWQVSTGYLWNKIGELARLNNCYTDFTHPRQMAFSGNYRELGEVFSLGHWGDVLFDGTAIPDNLTDDQQTELLLKKFTRKGGAQLAEDLWRAWNLPGTWNVYIMQRFRKLLDQFPVMSNTWARIRAFKSRYWATRWTAANFTIFANERPVTAPYFDTRMCSFVCTLPESLLLGRKIQIEFLKKHMPELARIPWQDHRPYNLFNYQLDRTPLNIPYRVMQKGIRVLRQVTGTRYVMRNWELQFTGTENDNNLRNHLSGLGAPESFVPTQVIRKYYNEFKNGNRLLHAHPLSMLLTLSVFSSLQKL